MIAMADFPLPYGRHDVSEVDIELVREALNSDWLTTGPFVTRFEDALSRSLGDAHAVTVTSGTAGLHAAYAALGVGPSTRVVTTPLTFVATQATAIALGADIVFADVREDTGNIDPEYVQALVTDDRDVIAAIDYAGHPADYPALRDIADPQGVKVLQDAAHSLGSLAHGRPVGSDSDVAVLSFFPTKNITTGEGGAVISRHEDIAARARQFSRQGLIRDPEQFLIEGEGAWHQEVHDFGLNYRLPDVLAALGLSQLSRLETFKSRRAEIKARYDDGFVDVPGLRVPHQDSFVDPMWHLYPLRVPASERRRIYESLREMGILVQVNYIPAYWHPAFDQSRYPRGLCPVAEQFYREEISLPMYTQLKNGDVDRVIEAVRQLML